MQLRPYQDLLLAKLQAAYREKVRRLLMCSPTGSGKSHLLNHMLRRTNMSVLILCHREELRDMICDTLKVSYGVIEGSRRFLGERVLVGMMQTVSRRLDDLPRFQWVISDEAHLTMAPTWRQILEHYSDAWHLGMSATPCRLDGQGLGTLYDRIIYGPSPRELITRGYLKPVRVFTPEHMVHRPKTAGADLNMVEAAQMFDTAEITGSAARHLRRLGPNRQTIVFCCTREHAEHTAGHFRMEGFRATHVDGSMSPGERKQRFGGFESGRFQVLVNVDLATTGYDNPKVSAEIMLRPTDSLALYLQMVGREMRIYPGDHDGILIDCVGNVVKHGMPAAVREWTLEGSEKRTQAVKVRQCTKCFAAFEPAPKCPECGYVFPVAPRRASPRERAGDLVEVTEDTFDTREQWLRTAPLKELLKGANTSQQLQEIAEARGYAPGWVHTMLRAKAHARVRRVRGAH